MLLLLAGLLMLTQGIRAATWRGDAKTSEDHPGQCIDESGQPHKVGTSWKPEKYCGSITCNTGPNNTLQVQGESCGVVHFGDVLPANCTLESQDDLPYPECCRPKLKCPNDTETNDKDHPDQCTDESGQPRKVGTSWPSEKSCAMLTCHKGGEVIGKSCGGVTFDYTITNCRLETKDDLPYPACCPEVKCPSDKKTNDKGPLRYAAAQLPNWPLQKSANRRRRNGSSLLGMRRRNGPSSGMRRRNGPSSGMRRRSGPSSGMRRRSSSSSGRRRRSSSSSGMHRRSSSLLEKRRSIIPGEPYIII